jgi:hypothetical protein
VGEDSFGAFSPGFGGGYGGSDRVREQVILSANLLAGIRAIVGLRISPQRPAPVKSASFAGVSIGEF